MSLLVWLPLNGTLENRGLSKATFSLKNNKNSLHISDNGKLTPQAYERVANNTIDYITSDIDFTLSQDFSMCCWCKVTGVAGTSANGIITNHSHSTGGAGITLKVTSAEVGDETCYISCSAGFGPDASKGERIYNHKYGTTNIFGSWHHLSLTYNKNEERYRLYVDGEEEVTFIFKNVAQARPFRIFDWSTSNSTQAQYKPKCILNDVRLYDDCLSKREINDIANGLLLHYKLDAPVINTKTINDVSPYYNNGQLIQEGTYENTSAHYDSALKLNLNNYITCGRRSDVTNVSASFWLKLDMYPVSSTVVFVDYSSKLAFGFYDSNKAIISCSGNQSKVVLNVNAYWKNNEWNYVVVTKNNNDYQCYINGNQLSLSDAMNDWTHYAEDMLYIGCRNNGAPSSFYSGLISDFRLYGITLTEEQAKELYTTPISLSKDYTLFGTQFIEKDNAISSFLKTGTIKSNEIRDCDVDGNTSATKLQVFADAIQSTDFIEW